MAASFAAMAAGILGLEGISVPAVGKSDSYRSISTRQASIVLARE
jgi:hypothetical protein